MSLTDISIGDAVSRLRCIAGLTQSALAAELGEHRPTVTLVESGTRALRARELDHWAECLGTVASVLLDAARAPRSLRHSVLMAALAEELLGCPRCDEVELPDGLGFQFVGSSHGGSADDVDGAHCFSCGWDSRAAGLDG